MSTPPEESYSFKTVTCGRCKKEFQARVLILRRDFVDLPPWEFIPEICDPCARQIGDEMREKQRAAEERRRLAAERAREEKWSALCPKEFRLTTENGGATDIVRLERDCPKLKEVLAWEYNPRGLILRGETGKCKTRALWRLLRKLSEQGFRIVWMTAAEFDRQCRDAAGNFTLTPWFNNLATADIFVLEDLGQGDWSRKTESIFFDLVDKRTREHRPILVTTNDTAKTLAARLSENRADPLVRRLKDFCDSITFV